MQKTVCYSMSDFERCGNLQCKLLGKALCCACQTEKCLVAGLAELGTMCDSHRSCSIVKDSGLSAAFTIAHELGHVQVLI